MSVINQMLVDLERRHASGDERNRIPNHVRALPGAVSTGLRMGLLVTGAALATFAVLSAAGWWWTTRLPVAPADGAALAVPAPPSSPTAPPMETETAERIAQRMSLELSRVPEDLLPNPPVSVDTVIPPRESRHESQRELPAAAPRANNETAARTRTSTAAAKASAAAPAPPRVEIDKKVRALTPRQRADAEYAKGAKALQQSNAADAREAFDSALRLDPAHHAARQALVGILLEQRRAADASQVLQDGLQIAPAQIGFAMTLARLHMERGDLEAGVQTLARSLDFAESSPDYIAFYAGLLQRQQQHAAAVEQFRRALDLRRNAGVWWLGLGVSLEALGRNNDAQDAYRRAKAAGDLTPELHTFADQRLR
jgi:MSHA biogenesis protein MshN